MDWILKEEFSSALDIGTGTGCIPIALAKNKKAVISAIDISNNALLVARKNAKINGVEINFIHQDILISNDLPKVDIIVTKQFGNTLQDLIISIHKNYDF